MTRRFSSIPEAVEAIRNGRVVIVVDDENRENEGDYICAAEKATPETINLLLSGRGDFCMPVLADTALRLRVKPLVEQNETKLGTAFLTPLDHVSAKTGITAEERAHCVRAIADPESRADDFVRPGHVHLLLAKEGGVLRSMGQKLWSALSAWAINNAGYQKYGEALDQPRGRSADLLRPCRQC